MFSAVNALHRKLKFKTEHNCRIAGQQSHVCGKNSPHLRRPFADSAVRQRPGTPLKVRQRERCFISDLAVGKVVIPDLFRRPAFGKKEQVRLDARTGVDEGAQRQTHDAPKSQSLSSLRLVWTKAVSLVRKRRPHPVRCRSGRRGLEAADDMLEKEHLSGAGLMGKASLRVFAFLAAERRIHQHNIKKRGPFQTDRRRSPRRSACCSARCADRQYRGTSGWPMQWDRWCYPYCGCRRCGS